MKQQKKKIDLIDELQMLELYYCKESLERKKLKTNENQSKIFIDVCYWIFKIVKQVDFDFKYKLYRPICSQRLLKSDFNIYVPIMNQLVYDDFVLGEVQALPMSWDSKINYATYNFHTSSVEIQFEAQINQLTPLSQIKHFLSSQNNQKLLEAINYIETDHESFKTIQDDQLVILDHTFIDQLLEANQDEFFSIMKHTLGNTMNTQIYVNEKMLHLIGVLPNIYIDAVLSEKKVPSVLQINDIYDYWSQDAWNFTHSYQKKQEVEFETYLNIYEAKMIPAHIKQTYLGVYNMEHNTYELIQCTVIKLKNLQFQQELLKKQRILKNSAEYLNENQMNEKNKELFRDLKTKLSVQSYDNWRTDKHCGYKLKFN